MLVLGDCSQEAAHSATKRVNAHSVNSPQRSLLLDFGFHLHRFLEAKGNFFYFFSTIENRNRNFAISSECSLARRMGKRFGVGFPITSHLLLPASRVMILWTGVSLG